MDENFESSFESTQLFNREHFDMSQNSDDEENKVEGEEEFEHKTNLSTSAHKVPLGSTGTPKLNDLKTPVWQVKSHAEWVKHVLISEIIESTDSVCELSCGKGMDLGKWARAKIARYVGIDSNSELLKEAKERWKQKKRTIPCRFRVLQPIFRAQRN